MSTQLQTTTQPFTYIGHGSHGLHTNDRGMLCGIYLQSMESRLLTINSTIYSMSPSANVGNTTTGRREYSKGLAPLRSANFDASIDTKMCLYCARPVYKEPCAFRKMTSLESEFQAYLFAAVLWKSCDNRFCFLLPACVDFLSILYLLKQRCYNTAFFYQPLSLTRFSLSPRSLPKGLDLRHGTRWGLFGRRARYALERRRETRDSRVTGSADTEFVLLAPVNCWSWRASLPPSLGVRYQR